MSVRVYGVCPTNSVAANGTSIVPDGGYCIPNAGYMANAFKNGVVSTAQGATVVDNPAPSKPQSCPRFGQPITPLLGAETHTVSTGLSVGGQPLLITFDNRKVFSAASQGVGIKAFGNIPALGALWESSLHKNLKFGTGGFGAQLMRGNGTVLSFRYNPATSLYSASADINDKLEVISGGFRFTSATGVIETYNTTGQLSSVADTAGNTLSYTYSTAAGVGAPAAGYLMSVSDNAGRSISFAYSLPAGGAAATDGLITGITDASGQSITIGYDAAQNLSTMTWPDGKSQGYVYENANLGWAATGMVDENGARHITWGYDAQGRATSTELAGGVNKYSVSYTAPPSVLLTQTYDATTGITTRSHDMVAPSGVVLTLPNGQSSTIGATSVQGMNLATGLSQPAGSGCAAANSSSTFDAAANLTSRDDFTQHRSCFAYDTKNQEIARVEGLASTTDCATVLPANATLPAGARKITTTYHPDWRIPVRVTTPGAITTYVYQGQSDPFNANAVATCTSAPVLPNGKMLPVVCKQVTQALLVNGNVDSAVPIVVAVFTYDASGRALSSTDTAGHTTSYAYYGATGFTGVDPNMVGHTVGDLQSITGPNGLVTTFDLYDKSGRVLQSTDSKGIVTQMTYSPRGWVTSVSTTAPGQSARLTTYAYDSVGQLTGMVSPDGTSTTMTYDAAHRLIGAGDAKGNSVVYTLDNMGNRTGEQIKDPSGALQQQMQRSFDVLNRVQQVGVGP